MLDEPGQDYPPHGTVLDLIAASRRDTFLSWVDAAGDGEIVVTAPKDASLQLVGLPVGEHLEIVWTHSGELRSLPVVLASISAGEQPHWQLRPAGVAKRGQRRDAVRAPLTVPVRLQAEGGQAGGATVDLSEGGLRCILDKERAPAGQSDAAAWAPEVGDVIRVIATLPDFTLSCLAEVTRRYPRDDERVELSARFVGLQEHEQDLIRRRVFARLRELRQRGLL
jgi:hypothetical protein